MVTVIGTVAKSNNGYLELFLYPDSVVVFDELRERTFSFDRALILNG